MDRDPLTVDAALLARLYDDHVDSVHAYLVRRLGLEPGDDIAAGPRCRLPTISISGG